MAASLRPSNGLTYRNPLQEYLGPGNLYDPWNRKFHYQAVTKSGRIVGYCSPELGSFHSGYPRRCGLPPRPGR